MDEQTQYRLIILFLLKHASQPLSGAQILECVLDMDGSSYFVMQEILSDLLEVSLISKEPRGHATFYRLTKEGEKTLSYFEHNLPSAPKLKVLRYLETQGAWPEKVLTPSSFYPNKSGNGTYFVRCQIVEDGTSILDLTLSVPTREAALEICKSWDLRSHRLYSKVWNTIL